MSQLYVPDGTWLLCTEGKKIAKMQVVSQTTIKIASGKLAATEEDRFDGNFVCLKMITAGAIIGVVIAAAIAASGGLILGSVLLTTIAGAATGAVAGSIVAKIPSICSLLCKPADWTELHPKVKIERKKALLQKATLSCLLGGTVSINLRNKQEAIDMGLLAGEDIYTESHEETAKVTDLESKDINRIAAYHRFTDNEILALGLSPSMFKMKGDSGFYAQLYKKEDVYVLVYRGTKEFDDVKEDLAQGTGISSEQYDKSVELAREIKTALPNEKVILTGHSLGGGLAAIASGETGYPCYTYNSAGVHDSTLRVNNIMREDMTQIQAYNASDDPLNMAQNNRVQMLGLGGFGFITYITGALPVASGKHMEIETNVGVIKGHTAIHIVNKLKQEFIENGEDNSSIMAKEK